MDRVLDGKHALVTGGGSGIGLAIAQALAGAGAQVTISGRRADVLDRAAQETDGLHPLPFDVSDEAATRAAIAHAADARGPLDITVANAGIAEGGAFREVSMADWHRIMAINLTGAFVTVQAALATHGRGLAGARVIAVSSIAGVRGLKGAVPYTVTKHGMIGLIRGLSEEYMGRSVTFNAICPGYVDTDIVATQAPAMAERLGVSVNEARDMLARGNRHRRMLEVDEVAGAALWLCSPAARSVNGQTIQIAGGQVA